MPPVMQKQRTSHVFGEPGILHLSAPRFPNHAKRPAPQSLHSRRLERLQRQHAEMRQSDNLPGPRAFPLHTQSSGDIIEQENKGCLQAVPGDASDGFLQYQTMPGVKDSSGIGARQQKRGPIPGGAISKSSKTAETVNNITTLIAIILLIILIIAVFWIAKVSKMKLAKYYRRYRRRRERLVEIGSNGDGTARGKGKDDDNLNLDELETRLSAGISSSYQPKF